MIWLAIELAVAAVAWLGWHLDFGRHPYRPEGLHTFISHFGNGSSGKMVARLGQSYHIAVMIVNPPKNHPLLNELPQSISKLINSLQIPQEAVQITVFQSKSKLQYRSKEEQFQMLYEQTGLQLFVQTEVREKVVIAIIACFCQDQERGLYGNQRHTFLVRGGTTKSIQTAVVSTVHHSIVDPHSSNHLTEISEFQSQSRSNLGSELSKDLKHLQEVLDNQIFRKEGVFDRLQDMETLVRGLQKTQDFRQQYRTAMDYRFAEGDSAIGKLDTFSSDYKMGVLFPMVLAAIYPLAYLLFTQWDGTFTAVSS